MVASRTTVKKAKLSKQKPLKARAAKAAKAKEKKAPKAGAGKQQQLIDAKFAVAEAEREYTDGQCNLKHMEEQYLKDHADAVELLDTLRCTWEEAKAALEAFGDKAKEVKPQEDSQSFVVVEKSGDDIHEVPTRPANMMLLTEAQAKERDAWANESKQAWQPEPVVHSVVIAKAKLSLKERFENRLRRR